MAETNAEHLERIKRFTTQSVHDLEWLVERAELSEELEKTNREMMIENNELCVALECRNKC